MIVTNAFSQYARVSLIQRNLGTSSFLCVAGDESLKLREFLPNHFYKLYNREGSLYVKRNYDREGSLYVRRKYDREGSLYVKRNYDREGSLYVKRNVCHP